ncbi:MAG: SPOR domain-containing protein [Prevotella sp.]|nr:SPOR domain-containing protein [Prevotella sp.]
MNDLSRHIEVLLLTNDCVVVPGLGGFVAHHVSASYDEHDGLFLPPTRTLGFNPQLKLNDSLLVQSYVETYDMSYPEALRRVELEVAEMKKRLSEKGEYTLHGVGTLRVNGDKSIVFEPCAAGLLTPTLYGLNFLEFHRLSAGTSSQENIAPINTDGQRKSRVIYIDRDAADGHSMLNIRVSAIRQFAVAAMIAVLFVLAINTDFIPEQKMEKNMSGVLSFLYSKPSAKSTVAGDVVVAKKSSPVAKKTVKSAVPAPQQRDVWSIVLCSHVSNKNAAWFQQTLMAEGIKATVISGEGSTAKVVFGQYSSQEEAYSALRQKKDNKRFVQGWITKL